MRRALGRCSSEEMVLGIDPLTGQDKGGEGRWGRRGGPWAGEGGTHWEGWRFETPKTARYLKFESLQAQLQKIWMGKSPQSGTGEGRGRPWWRGGRQGLQERLQGWRRRSFASKLLPWEGHWGQGNGCCLHGPGMRGFRSSASFLDRSKQSVLSAAYCKDHVHLNIHNDFP